MELQFEKVPLHCLKSAVCGVQNQEQTQELKLSDAMPDIGRVIGCWGQAILRGKQWSGDSAAMNGGIMVWVLYAPEDGTAPRTLDSWIPFQMKWDLPEGTREGTIRSQAILRTLDGRSTSPRKIMLRAGIAGWLEALEPTEEALYRPGEVPEDVALLQTGYPVTLPVCSGEKTFQLDEALTVPEGSPAPEKILYYTLNPQILEKKVLGNRAVFRGHGLLHALYLSENGAVHTYDATLPFSQLGELEGEHSGEGEPEVLLAVTDLDVTLDGEGHLRLKCGMTAQYLVYERMVLEITEDAYSPKRTVEPEMGLLKVPSVLDSRQEALSAEQKINMDGTAADSIFYPDLPRQRKMENGIQLELSGQFQVLYTATDGSLQCASARWEGAQKVDTGEDCQVFPQLACPNAPTITTAEGSSQAKTDLQLHCQTVCSRGISMVTGLNLGEIQEPNPDRPSLILRRAGKTRLWDMAKAAGSTVEAIRQANHLESTPEPGQMLLIPVI